jgi:pilus assembly protein FimV
MIFRRLITASALALAAMPVFAVSLGTVQMQSGLGQPLLATIPIYDASSYELQNLNISLAPNEAYRRIGIDRSRFDDVQIDIVEDEDGRSLVQLSSKTAFNEPVFNLLLETRLGNGVGQVKEFTALVDPPFIAKAAIQTIESPTVALTPVVAAPLPATGIRTPEVATGSKAAAEGKPAGTLATDKATAKKAGPAAQAAPGNASRTTAPPPTAVPQIPATATNQRDVISGESLYTVAVEHQKKLGDPAISLNQMMTAIQRANSQAFIRGDRNLLKRGSILRMPDAQQVRALLPEDSANLLSSQWARTVQAQPAPVLDAANRLATAAAVKPNTRPAQAANSNPVAANQGRLRIVPTVGAMNNAGSQSGASESGTGSELRAEAGVAQEDIVAGQLEISNLRSQLDEAAKLQAESKRLIELQNTQIKQLTQRMQDIEKAGGKASLTAPAQAEGQTAAPWYANPFVLLGGLLVIAVILGYALKRRR